MLDTKIFNDKHKILNLLKLVVSVLSDLFTLLDYDKMLDSI